MSKLCITIIVLHLISLASAYQQIPLRKDEYGLSIGDPEGNFHFEFFLDFLCEDSKKAYETIIKVMDEIDFYQQGIKLTYQFSPLSWHFFSFKINQALFFILQKVGAQQADKFIAYVFSHQQEFSEQKWYDKKISHFLDYFVQNICGVIKIDKAQFRSELNQGDSWNTVRCHWKYSVGTHGVYGTPTFNLNSVRIDGADKFTVSDWINFLEKFKKNRILKKQMTSQVDQFNLDFTNMNHKN